MTTTPTPENGSSWGTQPYGYQTTPAAPAPAAPTKNRSTGWIVATFATAALALVGMMAALFFALGGPATAGTVTNVEHHRSASHHAVIVHGGGQHTVTPSDQVKTWQRDLGQLNYYEGPVNGYLTPATTQSITYLQRDAHLPQTGTMTAATQAAMQDMLVHGNNQMGS